MKITPQAVIEALADRKLTNGLFRLQSAAEALIPALREAVLFTFPDVACSEHAAFAADLYDRGLFFLPFPCTAVAFERDLGPPHGRRGGMMLLSQSDPSGGASGQIQAITFSEVDARAGAYPIPVGFAREVRFKAKNTQEALAWGETTPLLSDPVMASMFGPGPRGFDIFHGRLINNVLMAMGLVTMLMSKGVTAQKIPASAKLNRAREKRGRPPIPDRFVVSIDIRSAHILHNADGSEENISGHTRGSPRMHWRRGHFRVLNRGEDDQRIIPVAPSLVGANDRADEVRAKAYQIRA